MREYRLTDFLPTTKKELDLRGWDEVDVILFSGDAYVDHPSFGAAVIGRTFPRRHYPPARLAWRLQGFQEARPSTTVLRDSTRMHGLDGEQIYRQPPFTLRRCLQS